MRTPGRALFAVPMLDPVADNDLPRPLVAAPARTAAFFDLDKTIIAKSSTLAFSRSFYQGGLINRRTVLRSAYAQFVYLVGGADHDQMERMRAYLSSMATGWDVEQVKVIVAETLHQLINPLIYDEAATLIEEHHLAGRDVVIVSTSGAEVVEPIGQMLGADHVIATRMVVEDGKYSGEIEYYAYGETKAEAIRELAETAGLRPVALLRLQRLRDRPADARGRRATRPPSTPTGRCARRRCSATGRCWCSPGRCGCGTGSAASACGSRPRWPRSRWAPAPPPPGSVWLAARRRGAARQRLPRVGRATRRAAQRSR